MNSGKIVSGIVALAIYLSIIFLVLSFYNIHQTKAKNYVEKNLNRVTVTLVNSDKTVFNKSEKQSTPKKPVPLVVKNLPKKSILKKPIPKKVVPKKTERAVKPKPKRVIVPKKPKKTVPKKVVPKKTVPKKVKPKKIVPKKPKKKIPKKVVPKKVVPKKPKKSAKDLFSSVKTRTPVRKVPKKRPKPPVHRSSSIKHNSSITDRLRATHQSGRVSNANRDRGVKNAYISKVKQRMNNWSATGMRGQWVTINLTIYQSGRFKYTASGVSGAMKNSLTEYMRRLNNMGGLGRHSKATPYSIQVRFRVN